MMAGWLPSDIASTVLAGLGTVSVGMHGLRGLRAPKSQRKPVRHRTIVRHRKVWAVSSRRKPVW